MSDITNQQILDSMTSQLAIMSDNMATKQDLKDLEDKLGARIDAVDVKIDKVEQRLEAKIDGVEQRLDAKIDGVEQRLDTKIDGVELRLGRRIDTAFIQTS